MLEVANTIVDPSRAFAAMALLALVGLIIWWLKRKRQKRVWLPTMRIMTLETRLLPKLLVRPPPWLAFLCFLILSVTSAGLALKPRTQMFSPFEPNQTRIHIFADMSPSVAAHTSLDDYAAKMGALYLSLKDAGRVTISASSAPTVIEPQGEAEVKAAIVKAGFHRGGLKLGAAMKQLLEDVGEVDRLFIAADRDAHSWGGFNWQYLTDDMHVVFYDLSEAGPSVDNLFINDARFLSLPNSASMEWDVEVARKASDKSLSGKLNAVYKQKILTSVPFHVSADKQRLLVRVQWPTSAVDFKGAKAAAGAPDVEPLIFRIEADDALQADNEYRTRLLGLKQDALLVADGGGERLLSDPANQLGIVFDVLGFRLKRFDFLNQPGPKASDYPFMVLIGGSGGGVDRFCPKSIGEARRRTQREANLDGAPGAPSLAAGPKIWLAPATLDADYRELCQCYARLLLDGKEQGAASKDFCAPVENRNHWLGLLPSLGAKQVGGDLGQGGAALAWAGHDQNSGLSVLAFTVPLAPSLQTGISHAQMPILVRELLTWQGILEARGGVGGGLQSWPRLDDVAQTLGKPATPLAAAELARYALSNVPFGESLLGELDLAAMPPRWTAQMNVHDRQLSAKKDREDPLPWLRLAALIVLGATLVEALAGLGRTIWRLKTKKAATALVLAALCGASILASQRGEAKTGFAMLGYDEASPTLALLAREVSHRTSIELDPKPSTFATLQAPTLLDAWLWVKNISLIVAADGRLKPEVSLWLKRGGFLVIETPLATAQLAKLTAGIAHGGEDEAGWLPLPPDHEMMRSFYLLDALPACGADIWRGFHYDGRLAILLVPYGFLSSLKDRPVTPSCATPPDHERSVRIFVNLIMVALATDYKKDQIHLPEILKRLR